MVNDWALLSAELQAALAAEAMRHAVETVAGHAETLATEIEAGGISDRGGPDALRLLAAIVRATSCGTAPAAGRA